MKPRSLLLLLLSACLTGLSRALQISSKHDALQAMQAESISLPCVFTVGTQDVGILDIEWIFTSPSMAGVMFATYTGGRAYTDISPAYRGRVRFTAADPASGDASLEISSLTDRDTGSYRCKVKKMPGSEVLTIPLTVLAPPRSTRCTLQGSPSPTHDLQLRCASAEGSASVTYTWTYAGAARMPASAKQDMQLGTLSLPNATVDFSGSYSCRATNSVGSDSCVYELRVTQHKEPDVGAVVAAVLVPILLIGIAIGVAICCLRRRNARRKEKELSHVIRMDESPPPPSSRSQSRASRPLTSQAGSRPLTSQGGLRPLTSQGGSRPLTSQGSYPGSSVGGSAAKAPSHLQPVLTSPPKYDPPSSSAAAATSLVGGQPASLYATVYSAPLPRDSSSSPQGPFDRLDERDASVYEEDEEDVAKMIADGIDPLDHHHPPKQRGYLV